MVSCFCNNAVVGSFEPFNKRNNARCSVCKSLERHRFVMLYFKKNPFQYEKTLHFAPESPLVKLLMSTSKNYRCGDINPSAYKIPNIMKLDVTNIPFKNEFNLVFASHILEHIIEDRKAMKEIYDSLVPNGKFITLVPQRLTYEKTYENALITDRKEREIHFGQHDHVRWYGLDFSQRLKDVGFYIKVYYVEEIEKDINKMIYDEKVQLATIEDAKKFGFLNRDILYECIKIV